MCEGHQRSSTLTEDRTWKILNPLKTGYLRAGGGTVVQGTRLSSNTKSEIYRDYSSTGCTCEKRASHLILSLDPVPARQSTSRARRVSPAQAEQ